MFGPLNPAGDSAGLVDQPSDQVPAKNANHEDAAEDEDGVDADAALLLPVDVLEVEPERELVQRQRRPDAKSKCPQARDQVGDRAPSSELDQGHVADHQQRSDAPDQVVDMGPADGHVVERPDVVADRVDQRPDQAESEQERQRRQEESLPARGAGQPVLIDADEAPDAVPSSSRRPGCRHWSPNVPPADGPSGCCPGSRESAGWFWQGARIAARGRSPSGPPTRSWAGPGRCGVRSAPAPAYPSRPTPTRPDV